MTRETLNAALAALPQSTTHVRVTFRTAFPYTPVALTFRVPAPVAASSDDFPRTRVELPFESGAIYRCSCHDIAAVEAL